MLTLSTIITALGSLTARTPQLLEVFKAAASTVHPDDSAAAHEAIEAHFKADDAEDDELQARLEEAAKR